MNRASAEALLKSTNEVNKLIRRKRQKAYFKPFFSLKKPWAKAAVAYTLSFLSDLGRLMKKYRSDCIKALSADVLFVDKNSVEKAKRYKTHEYLDALYNRVVVSDIRDVLIELTKQFTESLAHSYEKYLTNGLIRDAASLVYQDMGMEFNFNKFDRATRDYLRDKTIKWSKEVAATTEGAIKRELVNGYESGLGSYEIGENIRQASEFKYSRSEMIARTEVLSSCNYANYTASADNDFVIGFEWSATGDARTRPTHAAADGQKRKKGIPFNVGGYKLLYPGDTSLGAPAKEIIQCRCTLFDIFEGEELDSQTVYDEPDAGTKEWISRQTDDFQEEYWGGKTKKKLGDAGLLSVADKDKPLNEILDTLYPVKLKPSAITLVSDLTEAVAASVIRRANALWLYGVVENKEANVTLDMVTGKKLIKDVYGTENHIDESSANYKDWIKFLGETSNPVILIHNHPKELPPSIDDLWFFLKRKSVKNMDVVDKLGNLYLLAKKPDAVYDSNEIIRSLKDALIENYAKVQSFAEWAALSEVEKKRRLHQLYEAVISLYLRKAGIVYAKF